MKGLLLLITILAVTFTATSQYDTSQTPRVAVPSANKDTLYVIDNMYQIFIIVWEKPDVTDAKPVIVPVTSLQTYYRRED